MPLFWYATCKYARTLTTLSIIQRLLKHCGKKRRTQFHDITGGILVPELLLILTILFQTLRSEM